MKKFVIAVDGPSGAGKSTLSKMIAKELNIKYIDTGAMYRACALMALETGVDVRCKTLPLERMFEDFDIELLMIDDEQHVILNGVDITIEIREPQISIGASYISAIPYVRDTMVLLQREMASKGSVLLDGRDIGTNVFPNADIKIFLTADAAKRAERRYRELMEKKIDSSYEEVFSDLKKRDENDSKRDYAPLRIAKDAVVIDTTQLDLEESFEKIITYINEKLAEGSKTQER